MADEFPEKDRQFVHLCFVYPIFHLFVLDVKKNKDLPEVECLTLEICEQLKTLRLFLKVNEWRRYLQPIQ